MALPLGKITFLVGAGIIGSVLVKDGNASDFVKGALKIAWKQISRDDSTSSVSRKPQNDSLMDQVNSLRQELLMLSSNRPITIVTASGRGAGKYGIVITVVVIGCGYVWWKGWKLPDMMFATKRSLSDACTSIAQQLDNVYASIRSTRRQLSANIDSVDSNLSEVAKLTADTRERVTAMRDESQRIGLDVRNVRDAVETLEQKISRIEGKQDMTNQGVMALVDYAYNLESNLLEDNTQAAPSSSRITFAPKIEALPPPPQSYEASSPSVSNGSHEVKLLRRNSASISGHQRSPGISGVVEVSSTTRSSTGTRDLEETNSGSAGWLGSMGSLLSRTRSATNAVVQRRNQSTQQS